MLIKLFSPPMILVGGKVCLTVEQHLDQVVSLKIDLSKTRSKFDFGTVVPGV